MDGEHAWLFYSNPYDCSSDSPHIYFQPLIFLFGVLQFIAPTAPAVPFVILGGLFTFAFFYVLSILVEKVYSIHSNLLQNVLVLTLSWGGGCFVILPVLVSFVAGCNVDRFLIDPGHGMWFLNLGRNLIYPTEAFYHFLVFTLFLAVALRKKAVILGLTWILALSQPFTGLQYSLILLCWAVLERYFLNSKLLTGHDVLAYSTPVLFCIVYYLIFLPQFASHQSLMSQWSLAWNIKLGTIIGAYGIVGMLAFYRCCTKAKFIACFSNHFNRFLGVCFLVSFVLANHEALIFPIQPVHFTRGHIWTPLCLLGIPVLVDLWRRWRGKRVILTLAVMCWFGLILSDNIRFFLIKYTHPVGFFVQDSYHEIYAYLREKLVKPIILSENDNLSYLSAVYSSARPYLGHCYNTPDASRKRKLLTQFFSYGKIPPELHGYDFWVITEQFREFISKDKRFREIFVADNIHVFSYQKLDN